LTDLPETKLTFYVFSPKNLLFLNASMLSLSLSLMLIDAYASVSFGGVVLNLTSEICFFVYLR